MAIIDTYKFKPTFKKVGQMPNFTENQIKNEPMLFSCDTETAYRLGGIITKTFIDKFIIEVEDIDDEWIFDSRVHMLMKGWYPCIPGWHHDDVPRNTANGQPDYDNTEYFSEHKMCVIGDCSLTSFLNCETELPKVKGETVYKVWNEIIKEKYIEFAENISSCDVINFSWNDFHTGNPATHFGWRYFVRASKLTNRKYLNELRRQVQVYLPCLEEGW